MKKIMFNEKFGLQSATLNRTKRMTRRNAKYRGNKEIGFYRYRPGTLVTDGEYMLIEVLDPDEFSYEPEQYIRSQYHVGEIVAIAQSYESMANGGYLDRMLDGPLSMKKEYAGAGYKNKMFVKPELMPHHIKITGIKVERLQDISEEDAMKEGIIRVDETSRVMGCKPYYTYRGSKVHAISAKVAFISLIEEMRKKPKKEYREIPAEPYNPLVFAYDYELVD